MDTLYLLENEFQDAELPGRSFYCRDCMLLNGLLSAFPERTANLKVVRVAHARPRQVLVDAIGEENQWLPALLLSDDREVGGSVVNDFGALLSALHERHGFPEAHP